MRGKLFFYQIGGGEDESDRDIFVRGNIAVTYEYTSKRWVARPYDKINYVQGFGLDKGETVQSLEDFNKLRF